MAECVECGKEMGFVDRQNAKGYRGLCRSCSEKGRNVSAGLDDKTIEQVNFEKRELNLKIEAILLTTETAPNLNITERIEIVTAECAFGMNIFKV
ncbi:hypothetical protein RB2150_00090 [Rhodobacterales bacterium HTCC2150]|nr:hypothetical protein RB2150_00090 [Rhodobacterales bacterium HTCC2150] [Rhodobacteraceae bacterium HTCC2150]